MSTIGLEQQKSQILDELFKESLDVYLGINPSVALVAIDRFGVEDKEFVWKEVILKKIKTTEKKLHFIRVVITIALETLAYMKFAMQALKTIDSLEIQDSESEIFRPTFQTPATTPFPQSL